MNKYFYQMNIEEAEEEKSVSLHDCRATRMLLENGVLYFCFPDGFEVINDYGRRVFYTDEAQAEFPLLYSYDVGITVYVFTEENGRTIREEYKAEDFIRKVNEGIYSIEFLYSYTGYQTFKFDCWIWFDEEPYNKECEVTISAKNAVYRWNNMYEEEL